MKTWGRYWLAKLSFTAPFAWLRDSPGRRIALLVAGGVVLAACGGGNTSTLAPSADPFNPADFNIPSIPWLAANVNASGIPVYGGTLKIEGTSDVAAALDPQGEYEPDGFTVLRAVSRQLVSYPASANLETAESIVPDAATAMPTVSDDGMTYTFHIRSGILWNTKVPRQVTSQDFKRGLERECDPTLATFGNPAYYVETIAGFKGFCAPFEAFDPSSSPAARAAYINDHDVSGIQTPNNSTIVFTLTQPAVDFLNLLAEPWASAAPIEDLQYVPLTPGNPLYSDGPYEVSKYDVGHEIDLDHNPYWSQNTDPIRHDYVKNIVITLDLPGASGPSRVQDDLITGAADLGWNTPIPSWDLPLLTSPAWDPQFGAFPAPGTIDPYLVFNTLSPNNSGALGNVKVRRALEYAIDKVAIGTARGGPLFNQPLNQMISPGAEGYVPFNDYPTPGNTGDPARCRTLLQQAGVTKLTLNFAFSITAYAVFHEIQSDFTECGVTVNGTLYRNVSPGFFSFQGMQSGDWDIATSGWIPDWFGLTNGRSVVAPFLYAAWLGYPWAGGYDYGGDGTVDKLIAKAEAAPALNKAARYWHQVDEQIMAAAAVIPLETQLTTLYHSARVHNAIFLPLTQQYDITQVWLPQ